MHFKATNLPNSQKYSVGHKQSHGGKHIHSVRMLDPDAAKPENSFSVITCNGHIVLYFMTLLLGHT